MGVNKVVAFVRNLLGIKGTDGVTIASPTNPLDVQLNAVQQAFLATIAAANPGHTTDANNMQSAALAADATFETTSDATKIDSHGHLQILYAALTPLVSVSVVWYSTPTTPLGGLFGTSAVPIKQISGYNVAYLVQNGSQMAPYYKLRVVNGPTAQSAFPGFIAINWLNKDAYGGVFDFTDAEPSNLTKALVVKQFHQKTIRLTSTPLAAGASWATKGPNVVFTVDNTTDFFTSVGHGLVNGDTVRFTSGSPPAPLVAGTAYYIVNKTTDTFQVAATLGGNFIDITGTSPGGATYFFIATAGGFTANSNGYFAGTNWADMDLHVWGAPFNAHGTLYFTFSHDGITDHIGPVPVSISDITQDITRPLRNYAFWKVSYTNNSVAQTLFGIFVIQRASVASDLTRFQAQALGPNEPIKVNLALIEPSLRGSRGLLGADRTASGEAVVAGRLKVIDHAWFKQDPNHVLTVTGTGLLTKLSNGSAEFRANTLDSVFRAQTPNTVPYLSASESHFFFTLAGLQQPTQAGSYMFMGPLSATEGFAYGWQGTVFGVLYRNLSVDTFVPITDFNGDKMDGTGQSRYSRGLSLEPLDMSKLSPMRFLIEWFGAAPTFAQTMNPDGNWMNAHTFRWPNTLTAPFLSNADLPMAVEMKKATGEAADLVMVSGCWEGGNTGAKTEFERILAAEVHTGEQFLTDVAPTSANFYLGVAFRGANQANPVWSVIKIALDPTTRKPSGIDFLTNIAWSTRTAAAWVV